jgi:hypothetical protein
MAAFDFEDDGDPYIRSYWWSLDTLNTPGFFRRWFVTLRLWPLAGLAAVLPIVQALMIRRRRQLRYLGCCKRCGYSLTGNVSGVCPECGTVIAKKT